MEPDHVSGARSPKHRVIVIRDSDLKLYGAECSCGWESDYLTDDRTEAENYRLEHEAAAYYHGDEH